MADTEFKSRSFHLSLDWSGGPSVEVPMTLSPGNAYDDPAVPKEVRDQFKTANPSSNGNEFPSSTFKVGLQWRPFSKDLGAEKKAGETDESLGNKFRLKGGLAAQAGLPDNPNINYQFGIGLVAAVEQKQNLVGFSVSPKEWAQTGWEGYLHGTIDYYRISEKGSISGATREIDLDGYVTNLAFQVGVQKDLLKINGWPISLRVGGGVNVGLFGRMGPSGADGTSGFLSGGIAVRFGEDASGVEHTPPAETLETEAKNTTSKFQLQPNAAQMAMTAQTSGSHLSIFQAMHKRLSEFTLEATSLNEYNNYLSQMADGIVAARFEPGEATKAVELLVGAWDRTKSLGGAPYRNLIELTQKLHPLAGTDTEVRNKINGMYDTALTGTRSVTDNTSIQGHVSAIFTILDTFHFRMLREGVSDYKDVADMCVDEILLLAKNELLSDLPQILRTLIEKGGDLALVKGKKKALLDAAKKISDKKERAAVTKLINKLK